MRSTAWRWGVVVLCCRRPLSTAMRDDVARQRRPRGLAACRYSTQRRRDVPATTSGRAQGGQPAHKAPAHKAPAQSVAFVLLSSRRSLGAVWTRFDWSRALKHVETRASGGTVKTGKRQAGSRRASTQGRYMLPLRIHVGGSCHFFFLFFCPAPLATADALLRRYQRRGTLLRVLDNSAIVFCPLSPGKAASRPARLSPPRTAKHALRRARRTTYIGPRPLSLSRHSLRRSDETTGRRGPHNVRESRKAGRKQDGADWAGRTCAKSRRRLCSNDANGSSRAPLVSVVRRLDRSFSFSSPGANALQTHHCAAPFRYSVSIDKYDVVRVQTVFTAPGPSQTCTCTTYMMYGYDGRTTCIYRRTARHTLLRTQ